jgi:pimeloyl-ACP methyl ester carboxylesterase
MATAPSVTSHTQRDPHTPGARPAWMDIDWREHQRWLSVEGRQMNVIELGEGPPIVFVHGLGGAWQNWLEQLPMFAEHHRCIAVDLPGFGHSEMPAEKISISGYGRTLDAVCEQLNIEAACFVGNSMGGFVSAELAIAFPQRVERLVLVSAAGLSIEYQRNDRALAAMRRLENVLTFYTGWIASRSDSVTRRSRLRKATLGLVARHPERLHPALAAEQLRGSGKPGFIDALDALTDYPIRDRLPDIACPTLIVWGTDDRLVPLADASEFERLIPDSRKLIFDDTGHVPMLERPGAFNDALEQFLSD